LDPLPVCLAIDIEPEARLLRRRHPEPLVGFEKLLHLVEPIRDHLGALTGTPARLTWMLRMDPQIEEVYGSPSALAERYETELASLRDAGDEFGIHQHMWRWRDQWVADHGDPDWVAHCVDVGLRAYSKPQNSLRAPQLRQTGVPIKHLVSASAKSLAEETRNPGCPRLP
jgi:hypothetical protein